MKSVMRSFYVLTVRYCNFSAKGNWRKSSLENVGEIDYGSRKGSRVKKMPLKMLQEVSSFQKKITKKTFSTKQLQVFAFLLERKENLSYSFSL